MIGRCGCSQCILLHVKHFGKGSVSLCVEKASRKLDIHEYSFIHYRARQRELRWYGLYFVGLWLCPFGNAGGCYITHEEDELEVVRGFGVANCFFAQRQIETYWHLQFTKAVTSLPTNRRTEVGGAAMMTVTSATPVLSIHTESMQASFPLFPFAFFPLRCSSFLFWHISFAPRRRPGALGAC